MSNTDHNSVYVEAGKKYEDTKSTTGTFFLVGSAGFLLLILLWTDILPVAFSDVTKIMMTIVLSILFLFFLGVGVKSLLELKSLATARDKEAQTISEIEHWFLEHASAETLANSIHCEDDSMEQVYFLRAEKIQQLIKNEFPSLSENFLDYMTEKIYQMYFPD